MAVHILKWFEFHLCCCTILFNCSFQLLPLCKMQKCWNERRTDYVKRGNRRNEEESNACEINENTIGPPSHDKISKTRQATIWVRGTILTVISDYHHPDSGSTLAFCRCFFAIFSIWHNFMSFEPVYSFCPLFLHF